MSDEGWRAIFDAVKDAVPVVEDKTCPLEEYAKQFAERIMNNTGNKVELQFLYMRTALASMFLNTSTRTTATSMIS